MKKLFLSILSFLAILSPVYADSGSVASVSAGYGYTQYLNGEITTRSFNTFSTANLEQDLTTLPNETTVYIDEFDFRITVPNKFQANYKYTITFTWAGYKPSTSNAPFADGKSFYELFQYFDNIGRCRISNWNGTNLDADSCFKNYSMSYVLNPNGLNDSTVEVTITFTPKTTFYGFTTYFNYGNSLADPRLPLNAWVIQSVEYSTNYISSSGGESGSTGGVTSNDINNIINNQTQNTQDIIDNQNQNTQNILNPDTTDAENDASNFFNNFTDSDNGGLSGIITSPLVAVNRMLDNQCTPLTAIYKGKTISLSCGTEFWSKATGIKEFLNLVEGGLLCYLIIRKLYLLVQDLKNPDNDRVEVMKL